MIERDMAQKLSGMARWFPVVSLTGPRQSGKSTIVRSVFADYEYLNLENPEVRTSATVDSVVAERAKFHLNRGEEPMLYFYRDDSKREVDLIDATEVSRPLALEIKAGETYRDSFARHLRSVCGELGIPQERRAVVYRGSE